MLNGMEPVRRIELPRVDDRISFFYTDNCRLEKAYRCLGTITSGIS